MKKRCKDRSTAFSEEIRKECGICNIQGICSDRDGKYTVAIEAVDTEDGATDDLSAVFTDEELYIKTCLAEELGIDFSMLIHRESGGESTIIVRSYIADHVSKTIKCRNEEVFSESGFIAWWREHNHGKMRKAYQEEIGGNLDDHFFDRLLRKNESSWPESIDGVVTERDESGEIMIKAVIGNRISNACKVKSYDPNRYFGRDYKEWIHLMKVAQKLNVPLFLCTYSNRSGQESFTGVARIDGVSEEGLIYHNGKKPVQNVLNDVGEVKKILLNR